MERTESLEMGIRKLEKRFREESRPLDLSLEEVNLANRYWKEVQFSVPKENTFTSLFLQLLLIRSKEKTLTLFAEYERNNGVKAAFQMLKEVHRYQKRLDREFLVPNMRWRVKQDYITPSNISCQETISTKTPTVPAPTIPASTISALTDTAKLKKSKAYVVPIPTKRKTVSMGVKNQGWTSMRYEFSNVPLSDQVPTEERAKESIRRTKAKKKKEPKLPLTIRSSGVETKNGAAKSSYSPSVTDLTPDQICILAERGDSHHMRYYEKTKESTSVFLSTSYNAYQIREEFAWVLFRIKHGRFAISLDRLKLVFPRFQQVVDSFDEIADPEGNENPFSRLDRRVYDVGVLNSAESTPAIESAPVIESSPVIESTPAPRSLATPEPTTARMVDEIRPTPGFEENLQKASDSRNQETVDANVFLQTEDRKLNTENTMLKASVESLQTRLVELHNQLTTLQSDKCELLHNKGVQDTNFETLKRYYDQENTTLRDSVKKLKSRNDALIQELVSRREDCPSLCEQAQLLSQALEIMKKAVPSWQPNASTTE